jgi:hypothetical protein
LFTTAVAKKQRRQLLPLPVFYSPVTTEAGSTASSFLLPNSDVLQLPSVDFPTAGVDAQQQVPVTAATRFPAVHLFALS